MASNRFGLFLVLALIMSVFSSVTGVYAQEACDEPKPKYNFEGTLINGVQFTTQEGKVFAIEVYNTYFECLENGINEYFYPGSGIPSGSCPKVTGTKESWGGFSKQASEELSACQKNCPGSGQEYSDCVKGSCKKQLEKSAAVSCSGWYDNPDEACPYYASQTNYNFWKKQCEDAKSPDKGLIEEGDKLRLEFEALKEKLKKEIGDAIKKNREACEKSSACSISCKVEGDPNTCKFECLNEKALAPNGQSVCNEVSRSGADLSSKFSDEFNQIQMRLEQLQAKRDAYTATEEPSETLDSLLSQLQSTFSVQNELRSSIFALEEKKVDDKKAEAKTAAEGKTLSAAAKARAERTFRPLFGRGPNDKPGIEVSSNGYPMGTFLAEQTEGQLILHATDELIFISNINNDATVIFEGIGAHKGENIVFTWFDTGAQSAKTGSTTGFSASIRGAEGIASLSTTAETTETEFGELEWLSPSLTIEEDAPAGEHEVELVIEQGGEIISAIPFVIDVEEEEEAEGGSVVGYIIGLAVLAGAAYGGYYAYTKFVKKGKKKRN